MIWLTSMLSLACSLWNADLALAAVSAALSGAAGCATDGRRPRRGPVFMPTPLARQRKGRKRPWREAAGFRMTQGASALEVDKPHPTKSIAEDESAGLIDKTNNGATLRLWRGDDERMEVHPHQCRFLMKRVRHFINLTNGIEVLPRLSALGIPASDIHFMRLQSSHCEIQAYLALLENLDHNLLMQLALGNVCLVYDCGSRGTKAPKMKLPRVADAGEEDGEGEGEEGDGESASAAARGDADGEEIETGVPRAVWMGIEWVKYVLGRVWMLENRNRTPTLKGLSASQLFRERFRVIPKGLRRRLSYYRDFIPSTLNHPLRIYGMFCPAQLDDGRRDQCVSLMHAWRHQQMQRDMMHGTGDGDGRIGGEAADADIDVGELDEWLRGLRDEEVLALLRHLGAYPPEVSPYLEGLVAELTKGKRWSPPPRS